MEDYEVDYFNSKIGYGIEDWLFNLQISKEDIEFLDLTIKEKDLPSIEELEYFLDSWDKIDDNECITLFDRDVGENGFNVKLEKTTVVFSLAYNSSINLRLKKLRRLKKAFERILVLLEKMIK